MTSDRHVRRVLVVLLLCLVTVGAPASTPTSQAAIGVLGDGASRTYPGSSYGRDQRVVPTGTDEQSKLWYFDQAWWALMVAPADQTVRVHELMRDHTWRPTGAVVGGAATVGDALLIGSDVWAAYQSGDGFVDVVRLGYDSATREWAVVPGFPVRVSAATGAGPTLARDSTGRLWAAWRSSTHIVTAWSDSAGLTWSAPSTPPVPGSDVGPGEALAVVAFDRSVGLMWSDQRVGAFHFAVHRDGAPDGEWAHEIALQGPGMADDHISLKVVPGQPDTVVAAVKTSLGDKGEPGGSPLIEVLARSPGGQWAEHAVATVSQRVTQPLLVVDASERSLHVFLCALGGEHAVRQKTASLDDFRFPPGSGRPVMARAEGRIASVTGSKQAVDAGTGIVVVASDLASQTYQHAEITVSPGEGPPPASARRDIEPPTAPSWLGTSASTADAVHLFWTYATDGERWWPAADRVPVRGYRILRDGAEVGSTALTAFVDRPARAGGQHSYAVVAVDLAGNVSPPGPALVVSVPTQGGVPHWLATVVGTLVLIMLMFILLLGRSAADRAPVEQRRTVGVRSEVAPRQRSDSVSSREGPAA